MVPAHGLERRRADGAAPPGPRLPHVLRAAPGRAAHGRARRARGRAVRAARPRLLRGPAGVPGLGCGGVRAGQEALPVHQLLPPRGPRAHGGDAQPAAVGRAAELVHEELRGGPVPGPAAAPDPGLPRRVPGRLPGHRPRDVPPHEPPGPHGRGAVPGGRVRRARGRHGTTRARGRRGDRHRCRGQRHRGLVRTTLAAVPRACGPRTTPLGRLRDRGDLPRGGAGRRRRGQGPRGRGDRCGGPAPPADPAAAGAVPGTGVPVEAS